MFRLLSVLCLVTFAVLFMKVDKTESKGLKEEFSWSRITYAVPGYGLEEAIESRDPVATERPGRRSQSSFSSPETSTGAPRRKLRRGRTTTTTTTTTTQAPIEDVVQKEDYIYQNNIPMGANRWQDKLFITVPRRRDGVPSTLNYVPMNSTQRHNVPLIPYPDFQTNRLDEPAEGAERLVSVYRVHIDPCDRLWFVDAGATAVLGAPTVYQPQSVVIIDLKTDKIIKRHYFGSGVADSKYSLASINVDTTAETCDDAFAYIPDLGGYGMVVYSLKDDDSWRVTHNYFHLEPEQGDFSIGGYNFQWLDGIFSVALSGIKSDGTRDVYFHAMSGINLYKVSNRILKDKALATREYHGKDFEIVGKRNPLSQTSTANIHQPSDILFMNLVSQNAVGCWNTNHAFDKDDFDIVQKDDKRMIYPSDLRIYKNDIIVLTCAMPVFLYGKLDYDETNFRVWMNSVEEAIKDTKCESRLKMKGIIHQ